MKLPKVFMVQTNSLLSLAMMSLFAADTELKVIPSRSKDVAGLLNEIGRLQPDVIVMDEDAFCTSNDFLAQLLTENPKLCVIVIHQNSNRLNVIRKDDVILTSAADLVNVISSV